MKTLVESGTRQLEVCLIRATNYTDDGYPIRTKVGVIRSNTLTQMRALVEDAANHPFFGQVRINVRVVDEAIQRVPVEEILRLSRTPGVRLIVMVVGVQTNQFPRAQDIAAWFLPYGIPVLIGGFHVSGMYAMIHTLTADLRAALMNGIILVAGEVEGGRLANIMQDVLVGEAQPFYDFLSELPDLTNAPVACLNAGDFKGYASPFGTEDTSRGCLFACKFCTIINVQGKTMRYRDPTRVVQVVRDTYFRTKRKVTHWFFPDDNIARNPSWRDLFARLTQLREVEGIPVTFMMQADLAAKKSNGDFFELAARAGCVQVFFGLETMNPLNLRAQGKFQNQVPEYEALVRHCNALGITCHAGYIIGLDYDTPASVQLDIQGLQEIGFNSASFYILTPLPGSEDHQDWWKERRWMHPDFNTYDSNHVAVAPKSMTVEELAQTHRNVWEWFYSTEHMASVLKGWQKDRKHYWGQLFFYAWYLYASRVEKLHPMNCGFWTVRNRHDRRPMFSKESFVEFWWHETKRAVQRVVGIGKLFLQLEEVWLRSRPKTKVEEALHNLITSTKQDAIDWRDLKARELVALYARLRNEMPEIKVPSIAQLWLKKHNPFASAYTRSYVQRVWSKWYRYLWNPLKWIEVWIFEFYNGLRFTFHLLTSGR